MPRLPAESDANPNATTNHGASGELCARTKRGAHSLPRKSAGPKLLDWRTPYRAWLTRSSDCRARSSRLDGSQSEWTSHRLWHCQRPELSGDPDTYTYASYSHANADASYPDANADASHSDAYSDTAASNSYSEAQSNTDSDPNGYCNSNPDCDTYSYCNTYCNGDSYSYSYSNTHRNGNSYCNGHSYRNGDTYGNGDSYSYGNPYLNTYSNSNTYTYTYTYRDRDANSHAYSDTYRNSNGDTDCNPYPNSMSVRQTGYCVLHVCIFKHSHRYHRWRVWRTEWICHWMDDGGWLYR
jgi:hypothetical protein